MLCGDAGGFQMHRMPHSSRWSTTADATGRSRSWAHGQPRLGHMCSALRSAISTAKKVFVGDGVVVVGQACLGMRQLEEAVLDVLFEAKRNGECPGVAEISRQAGIWSGGDTSKGEPGSVARSIA